MRKICFISYRRQDSKIVSENIGARINRHYRKRVFLDDPEGCENGVELGDDFVKQIEQRINESSVMVVVIGPEWEQLAQTRRELGMKDWVIFEIEQALNRTKPVPLIPVLVGGALMPNSESVPDGLRRSNGIVLRSQNHEGYEADMRVLVSRIKDFMGLPDNPRRWNQAMLFTWLGSVIFLLLFSALGSTEQSQVQSWLGFLIVLPGFLTVVLAYSVPLDPKSVFIRTLILYLGLFVLFGLSLTWLVAMDLKGNALLSGVALALVAGLVAAAIARKGGH